MAFRADNHGPDLTRFIRNRHFRDVCTSFGVEIDRLNGIRNPELRGLARQYCIDLTNLIDKLVKQGNGCMMGLVATGLIFLADSMEMKLLAGLGAVAGLLIYVSRFRSVLQQVEFCPVTTGHFRRDLERYIYDSFWGEEGQTPSSLLGSIVRPASADFTDRLAAFAKRNPYHSHVYSDAELRNLPNSKALRNGDDMIPYLLMLELLCDLSTIADVHGRLD